MAVLNRPFWRSADQVTDAADPIGGAIESRSHRVTQWRPVGQVQYTPPPATTLGRGYPCRDACFSRCSATARQACLIPRTHSGNICACGVCASVLLPARICRKRQAAIPTKWRRPLAVAHREKSISTANCDSIRTARHEALTIYLSQ